MDELILTGWTVLTVLVAQADLASGLVLSMFLVSYLVYSLKNWAQRKKAANGTSRQTSIR